MKFWRSVRSVFTKSEKRSAVAGWNVFSFGSSSSKRSSHGVLKAFETTPALRKVVSKIAGDVAGTQIRAFKRSGSFAFTRSAIKSKRLKRFGSTRSPDFQEIESHEVSLLLSKPSATMTGYTLLEISQKHLDLVGEAFWEICDSARSGFRFDLKVHNPTSVELTDTGFRIGTRKVAFDRMVWFKVADVQNPYGRGSGIAGCLTDEIDVDCYAAETAASILGNQGMPEAIVSLEGVDGDALKAIETDWKNRFSGSDKRGIPLLTSAKFDVKEIARSMVDLGLVATRQDIDDRIRSTFGVPPELLGDVENSNRATITEAGKIYGENVLSPRLRLIEDTINGDLLPLLGVSDAWFLFDSPMPDDRDEAREDIRTAPHLFTINEQRAMLGYEPLDGDIGNAFTISNSIQIVSADEVLDRDSMDSMDPDSPRSIQKRVVERSVQRIKDAIDAKDLFSETKGRLKVATEAWARREAKKLGTDLSKDALKRITDAAEKKHWTMIKKATKVTQRKVARIVSNGREQGLLIDEIADRLKSDIITIGRSQRIANTEIIRATGQASQDVFESAGVEKKLWVASFINTRDTHADLDGEEIPTSERFISSSGAQASYPGGFGVPEEDCNCACAIVAITEKSKSAENLSGRDLRAIEKEIQSAKKPAISAMRKAVKRGLTKQVEAAIAELRKA